MTTEKRLPEFARKYAAGEVTWREIADELDGVSFGDLLLELARQGLSLLTAQAAKTPEQRAMWEAALHRAADEAMESTPWWWRTANGLALRMRDLREQRGLSLEDLAMRTGLAPRTLDAMERGRVWHIHVGVLIRVVDALGHRIDLVRRLPTQEEAAAMVLGEEPTEAERDHAVLKAWLARRSGRGVDDDPSLTAEQRAKIHRAIASEQQDEEGGDVMKSILDEHELVRVDLHAWPVLRELDAGRHERWIHGAEALALYEQAAADLRPMSVGEVALMDGLKWRWRKEGGDGQA